jgi:hypothetical protein
MGGRVNTPPAERDEIPIDDGLSTHQEAVPVPLFWGKQKIPARWASPAIDPKAVVAPNDVPGKK